MGVVIEELNPICIGADIGQLRDPTAISVAEVSQIHTGKYRQLGADRVLPHVDHRGLFEPGRDADPVLVTQYTIRHIRRLPLGMSYPDVAIHIAEMLCSPLFTGRRVRVLLDVTGVGRPVYDDLKREIALREKARDAHLKPISFVHGENYNKSKGTLGKAFLVSRLQSLLQSTRVHAPDTAEVKATLEELRVYEIKVDNDGKDTYGAFRTGTHDDLATSLGLSVLEDPFSERVAYSKRVY